MPEQQENLPGIESGIFTVDKPVGPSSFRMVQHVRRALQIKKTGHSGTLDPFATGLLVICSGRPATRLISQLMDGEKVYEAVLQLGIETTTHDPEGEVVARKPIAGITAEQINECLAGFVGEQEQIPPLYSALKHKGKPLYHYARKGIDIERQPRTVTIPEVECLAFDAETVRIRVRCSKGTYIRTLAYDIGRELGCGAHLSDLRRLQSGFFSVNGAVDGAELEDSQWAKRALLENRRTVEEVQAALS
jgi:tRNA pseudouridine55 synthase